jgi:hypothetical protein
MRRAAPLPIPAWREGNFSDLRNGSGQPITIYDQTTMACTANCGTPNAQNTRQPFPGNILPASRLDPVALKLVSYFPQPNIPAQNAFTHQNNYLVSGKTPSLDNRIDTRIDHNFTSNFKMWGRASASDYESTPFNGFGNVGSSAGGSGFGYGANYNVALNSVYTLIHDPQRVGYGHARWQIGRSPRVRSAHARLAGIGAQAAAEQISNSALRHRSNNGVASLGSNWTHFASRLRAWSLV